MCSQSRVIGEFSNEPNTSTIDDSLLAEDEPLPAKLMQRLLNREGFKVLEAVQLYLEPKDTKPFKE
jgi:hypothetical protein